MSETIQMGDVISESDAAVLKNALSTEVKTWHSLTFGTPAQLVNFVNAAPAQGAGEIAVTFANGQFVLFYFL